MRLWDYFRECYDVTLYISIFTALLANVLTMAQDPSPSPECEIRVRRRIGCWDSGTKTEYVAEEEECSRRGCCYDAEYRMCYFPSTCEKVAAVGGGGSAFMVLPGEDTSRDGSVSMLSNTQWCERTIKATQYNIHIEVDLESTRLIHISLRHVPSPDYAFPFNITFYIYSSRKQNFYFDGRGEGPVNGIAYPIHSWHQFTARFIHILPQISYPRSCATLEFISCPAPIFEVNVTDPPPTMPPPPPLVPVAPDDRPSAIVMGSFGLTMMISLLIVFVIMDIPAYHRDFKTMRRNILSFYRHHCGSSHRTPPEQKLNGFRWSGSKESIVLTPEEEKRLQGLKFIDEDLSDPVTTI